MAEVSGEQWRTFVLRLKAALAGFFLLACAGSLTFFLGREADKGRTGNASNPISLLSRAVFPPPLPATDRHIVGGPSTFEHAVIPVLGLLLLGAAGAGTSEARAAAAEERRRLRHDLHDGPVQSLLGLQMFLARKAAEVADHPRAAALLKETGVRLEEVLSEIRRVVQPPEEAGAGPMLDVERALASEVERRRGDTETRLRFEAQPGVAAQLSAAQGAQAVWLVRNALTNCLRHARAREAAVRLHAANGRICLEIHDDGDGFDPGAVAGKGGTGLPSMQQRAADLGGTLTVHSQPGHGTRVMVEFPRERP